MAYIQHMFGLAISVSHTSVAGVSSGGIWLTETTLLAAIIVKFQSIWLMQGGKVLGHLVHKIIASQSKCRKGNFIYFRGRKVNHKQQ